MKTNTITQQAFEQRYQYDPEKDLLGEGGFGSVYKAKDKHRHITVAIKVAKVKSGSESVSLLEETAKVKHLSHPNIAYYEACYRFSSLVGIFDFGILQYYKEGNLQQLLDRESLLFEQKDNILKGILSGLHYLHDHQIIHRDLKPRNILILKDEDNEYVPKITDFGISKELDADKSSFFDNSIMGAGTFTYSPPEQLSSKKINKNADLWSFGVLAYQVFTGQLPFASYKSIENSSGRQQLLEQINRGDLPDGINLIPEPWQTVIRQCLIPDPQKRLKQCSDCEKILSGSDTDAIPEEKVTIEDEDEQKDDQTRFYVTDDHKKENTKEEEKEKAPETNNEAPESKRKFRLRNINPKIFAIIAISMMLGAVSFIILSNYKQPEELPIPDNTPSQESVISDEAKMQIENLLKEGDKLLASGQYNEAIKKYAKAELIDNIDTVIKNKLFEVYKISANDLSGLKLADLDKLALDYCSKALAYKKDPELEKLKKEIESRINQ